MPPAPSPTSAPPESVAAPPLSGFLSSALLAASLGAGIGALGAAASAMPEAARLHAMGFPGMAAAEAGEFGLDGWLLGGGWGLVYGAIAGLATAGLAAVLRGPRGWPGWAGVALGQAGCWFLAVWMARNGLGLPDPATNTGTWIVVAAAILLVATAPAGGNALRAAARGPARWALPAVASAFAAAAWGATALGPPDPALTRTPNILLVTATGLRSDASGAYGAATDATPVLTELAADALVAEWAVPPDPDAEASLAALLAGAPPRLPGGPPDSSQEAPMQWADWFGRHGYRSAAVVPSGLAHLLAGYDRVRTATVPDPAATLPQPSYGDRLASALPPLLDAGGDEAPFFLHVHLPGGEPPWPITAAAADSGYKGPLSPLDGSAMLNAYAAANTAGDRAFLRDAYSQAVRVMDRDLGRVLAVWRQAIGPEASLILVAGVNGVSLGERDPLLYGPGRNLQQESLGVPLVIHGTGVKVGRIRSRAIALVDLGPMVADFLGDAWPGSGGRSLFPIAEDVPADTASTPIVNADLREGPVWLRAAYAGKWKLIYDVHRKESRLFDLLADPGERRDRAAAFPDLAQRLREGSLAELGGVSPAVQWAAMVPARSRGPRR